MIKELISIRLRSVFLAFVSGKDKNGNPRSLSKGRMIGFGALYLFLLIMFLGIVFTLAIPMAMIFVYSGAEEIYHGLFTVVSVSAIFIFGIFETKSELFECKDNELLLAMPIKTCDIVISRIFTVLIYNYIIEAIIIVPQLTSSLLFGGTPIAIFGCLAAFVLIPPFATALSAAVGYLVALVSHKLRRFKTVAVIALTLVFLCLYFWGMSFFSTNFEELLMYIDGNAESIAENLSVLGYIGSASLLKPIPFIAFIAVCAGVSYLAYRIISARYLGIITKGQGKLKVAYKEKKLSGSGAFISIVKKEFSRFTSSATYVLNGSLGYVFVLFIAVYMLFMDGMPLNLDPEILAEFGEIPPEIMNLSKEFFMPIAIAAMVFCYSMNMMSASALSLEGRAFWIIKSLPVSSDTVVFAKLTPSVILNAACALVSGVLCSIASGADILGVLFYIFIPFAASVAFSMIGAVFGALFPKFDFINDAEVVKQAFSVFMTMIASLLLAGGAAVLLFLGATSGLGEMACFIILGLFLLIDIILYFVIKYPIAKKVDSFAA